jgi:AcrR family transcriptional regulator
VSADNRERLLEAGFGLLSEKTFSEISMDQVAERSGVTKPMIYYYFKSKEGYYRSLAEHLLKMARNELQRLFDPDLTMRQNLLDYVRFRVRHTEEHPEMAGAFLSIMMDPNIGILINEMQQEFDIMRMKFIDPMFDRAVENGEISPGVNRTIVMTMLNSFLVSYTFKRVNGIFECGEEMNPEEVVDIIFDGIAARREDSR